MNKENAHLYLPLIQALAEGKTIQHKWVDGHWDDIDNHVIISFYEPPHYYRIKPEPRTFEMWLTPTGSMYTSSQMTHNSLKISDCERITVQEVLE
jgi:hypothetical protein